MLFIIGGKSNNTDIFETFRAMADALREHFSQHGPTPLYVVIGRGGPNLVRGMGAMRDTLEALGLPYRIFGFDSDMSEVVGYARQGERVDEVGRARAARGASSRSRSRRRPTSQRLAVRLTREIGMYRQGVGDFKYYVGISSLAQIATRQDRVCVLNILGGESSDVTPVGHEYSGGNVVFGTSPGRRGQVLETKLGNIPVYNNVREGLDDGHRFNCGVVYLPPSAARDGVAELIRVNPGPQEDLHRHREDVGARRARDPGDGPGERHRHLRRQQPGRGRCLEPGAHRRRARRRHARAKR